MSKIPLLSFFSGGGFLDLGFEMAGFDVQWSNEFVDRYAEIYVHGFSTWRSASNQTDTKDTKMNHDNIDRLSKTFILREAFGSVAPEFFGIIGGPPCQDFSHSGKNQGVAGTRGQYTQSYVDLICEIQPHFFVMENVPGLYKKKHIDYFESVLRQLENSSPGYITSVKILGALELGIPQDRDRLFLIGFRNDLFPKNLVKHSTKSGGEDWFEWPRVSFPDPKKLRWPQTTPFGDHNVSCPKWIPAQLTINRLVLDEVESLPNGKDTFVPYSKKFKIIDEGDVSGKSFKRLHRYRYSPTGMVRQ